MMVELAALLFGITVALQRKRIAHRFAIGIALLPVPVLAGLPPILLDMPPAAANGWYLLTVPIGFAAHASCSSPVLLRSGARAWFNEDVGDRRRCASSPTRIARPSGGSASRPPTEIHDLTDATRRPRRRGAPGARPEPRSRTGASTGADRPASVAAPRADPPAGEDHLRRAELPRPLPRAVDRAAAVPDAVQQVRERRRRPGRTGDAARSRPSSSTSSASWRSSSVGARRASAATRPATRSSATRSSTTSPCATSSARTASGCAPRARTASRRWARRRDRGRDRRPPGAAPALIGQRRDVAGLDDRRDDLRRRDGGGVRVADDHAGAG